VAANSRLRAVRGGVRGQRAALIVPSIPLCTDNGAMVAASGANLLAAGRVSGSASRSTRTCRSPGEGARFERLARRLRWRRVGAGELETIADRLAAWPAPAGGAARHMFALSTIESFGAEPLRLAADDDRWALAVVFPGRLLIPCGDAEAIAAAPAASRRWRLMVGDVAAGDALSRVTPDPGLIVHDQRFLTVDPTGCRTSANCPIPGCDGRRRRPRPSRRARGAAARRRPVRAAPRPAGLARLPAADRDHGARSGLVWCVGPVGAPVFKLERSVSSGRYGVQLAGIVADPEARGQGLGRSAVAAAVRGALLEGSRDRASACTSGPTTRRRRAYDAAYASRGGASSTVRRGGCGSSAQVSLHEVTGGVEVEQDPLGLETFPELRGGEVDGQCDRLEIARAQRQHPSVVVAALAGDAVGVAGQDREFGPGRCGVEADEVERDPAGSRAGAGRPVRQQVGEGDVVELRQVRQPGQSDRAITALVRADDHGLPAAVAVGLDVGEGQSLLVADPAEPCADGQGVRAIVVAHRVAPMCSCGVCPGGTAGTDRPRVALRRTAARVAAPPAAASSTMRSRPPPLSGSTTGSASSTSLGPAPTASVIGRLAGAGTGAGAGTVRPSGVGSGPATPRCSTAGPAGSLTGCRGPVFAGGASTSTSASAVPRCRSSGPASSATASSAASDVGWCASSGGELADLSPALRDVGHRLGRLSGLRLGGDLLRALVAAAEGHRAHVLDHSARRRRECAELPVRPGGEHEREGRARVGLPREQLPPIDGPLECWAVMATARSSPTVASRLEGDERSAHPGVLWRGLERRARFRSVCWAGSGAHRVRRSVRSWGRDRSRRAHEQHGQRDGARRDEGGHVGHRHRGQDQAPRGPRLVTIDEQEQTTASGLVIPDTAKEKPQQGTVVAVGPGKRSDTTGELIQLDVNEGDTVLFSKYGGTEVKVEGRST
jgi:co-chaperonin GroES (HSP10)/GNAT superfamily N-acetyltransferase